ncbi:hypothetical protein PR048_012773 [Dryococelus australis]|uniref:Reverse transcriptase Ty1/copia-type domain-containing protein n=1 Tax=Dryococelus australis TaxID=614101 RepID=A0ABQ9HQC4_9NEOP|nr:hypothetical protein PR048_012773 [Dryococelus australis]
MWTPIVLPPGEKAIETKWIFKTKKDGLKKVRLVAKGFQEEPANNVYAPVARLPTIRLLIYIAVSRKWEIRQLNVPTAFLNGYVDDDIYIKTPDGVKNKPGKALKLKRSLYSLHSAPRKCNERFHNFMEIHDMKRSASDFCLYIGENVWIIIWVDDMLITGEKTQVENLIRLLKGTMIVNYGHEEQISQSSFINKILSKFNMILCQGMNTPMARDFQVDTEEPVNEKFMFLQLIGSLMYIATVSRTDISYSVCYQSRFLNKPTKQLWKAGKRVLRYLQQTQDLCLTFKLRSDDTLVCYSDSDWAGDKLDRKSVSGCVLLHGQNKISWGSRKQGTVALSTAEAEYIACATAACIQYIAAHWYIAAPVSRVEHGTSKIWSHCTSAAISDETSGSVIPFNQQTFW